MCPYAVKNQNLKNFVPSCALMWSKTKTLKLCALMCTHVVKIARNILSFVS